MAHKIALGVVDCRLIEGLREADLEAANQLLHERTWRSLCRAGSADAPLARRIRFTSVHEDLLDFTRPGPPRDVTILLTGDRARRPSSKPDEGIGDEPPERSPALSCIPR